MLLNIHLILALFIFEPSLILSENSFLKEQNDKKISSIRNLDTSSSGSTICSGEILSIDIKTDPFPKENTWNVTDRYNKTILSGGPYSSRNTNYVTEKCLHGGNYRFIIFDTEGDGLCCFYGQGGYKLSIAGKLIKEGGAFGSWESTDFNIAGTPPSLFPSKQPSATPSSSKPTISPSYDPSTQPSNPPLSFKVLMSPTFDHTMSPSVRKCAGENKRARECGASGGKDLCCPGLVCHDYQYWRCVKEEFRGCAGPHTLALECGSEYVDAAPNCCHGLKCSDKLCVPT